MRQMPNGTKLPAQWNQLPIELLFVFSKEITDFT